ncbi:hypothetical protein ACIA8G_09560 [Lentzea sp. NPDC051213]
MKIRIAALLASAVALVAFLSPAASAASEAGWCKDQAPASDICRR